MKKQQREVDSQYNNRTPDRGGLVAATASLFLIASITGVMAEKFVEMSNEYHSTPAFIAAVGCGLIALLSGGGTAWLAPKTALSIIEAFSARRQRRAARRQTVQ